MQLGTWIMKQISSDLTPLNKKILPALWFGVLGALSLYILKLYFEHPDIGYWVFFPLVMIAGSYVLFKFLVLDNLDEVYDAGDCLIVKNKGREDRISLADIRYISYSVMVNPPRVTLSLGKESIFGTELYFQPRWGYTSYKNGEINDLIHRVKAARGDNYTGARAQRHPWMKRRF